MFNQENNPFVIVLGAAGFVGRHVCKALSVQGVQVIGLGHGHFSLKEAHFWGIKRWIEDDISLDALNRHLPDVQPAAIINCGGSGAVSYSYTHPYKDFQRAVDSTAAMLEWARLRSTSCRVVLVSSAAVYGDRGDTDATESTVRAPISPYGYHKVYAESLCVSFSHFFNVPVSIVRLFSVYGEGLRKQLLWDAMTKFAQGKYQFFGTGHELRDWIHVEDAARLVSLAATSSRAPYEIYNGAHTHATTRDVLTKLAHAAGVLAEPLFNNETHVGNPRRLTANCGHAQRQLAWTPVVRLEDGLSRYAAWFKTGIAT